MRWLIPGFLCFLFTVSAEVEEVEENEAVWSPDGTRIAFVLGKKGDTDSFDDPGDREIVIVHLKDGKESEPVMGQDVTWFPDSREIAYVREERVGATTVSLFRSVREYPQSIGLSAGFLAEAVRHPAVSPDEEWIVCVAAREGDRQLWLRGATESKQSRLTTDPKIKAHPRWSPDGKEILYLTDFSSRTGGWIWKIDLESREQIRLSPGDAADYYPVWSPDGSRIAFTSGLNRRFNIGVMDRDGGNRILLTMSPMPDFNQDWSPDGKALVFVGWRHGNPEIYRMNADGSGVRRLTNNEARDLHPRWSPDGSRILFKSNRDGAFRLWLMSAEGGEAKRVTKR